MAKAKSLAELVKLASNVQMTPAEREEQRVSFAYGTAYIENENVTRQMVEQAAKRRPEEEAQK